MATADSHGESPSAIRYAEARDGPPRRQGHLLAILPITRWSNGERILDEPRLFAELGAFLAYKHFLNRSGEVLPFLPERLGSCDFQWTYEHRDTQFSPLQAAKELMDYVDLVRMSNMTNQDNSTTSQKAQLQQPFALLGAARSQSSHLLSILAETMDLPQISGSSASTILDDAPLFARTLPSSNGYCRALMTYLHVTGVTHVGILFLNDAWGRSYRHYLSFYGKQFGISIYSVGYTELDDFDKIAQDLLNSKLRYFIGLIKPGSWQRPLKTLYQHGLMGKKTTNSIHYQWFFGGMLDLVSEGFVLDAETDWDLAHAVHGSGVVAQKITPHEAFDNAMRSIKANNALREEFISSHSEPHLLENFTFDFPGWSKIQYWLYDAVIAIGITACETQGLFTGTEFYNKLLKIDFVGTSGRLKLHPKTGNRRIETVEFDIINLVIEESPDSGVISFSRNSSAVIDFKAGLAEGNLTLLQPFVYNDNTTIPPPILPKLEENMNLIPKGAVWFLYGIAALTLLQATGWGFWVFWFRHRRVVRSAQPEFLLQLCLGTFIMAMAIYPLSMQEPISITGLNVACRSIPWLLCLGFCFAMSALLSKAMRIKKLLMSGTNFRRIQVQPVDVMKPFFGLLSINVMLLTAWTASPYSLAWQRTLLDNFDEFGRRVESIGMCQASGQKESLFFFIPLVVANATVLGLATYHTYRARNLPSEFSETSYLFLSMISLSEALLLGGVSLATVRNDPTGFFVVMSLMICIGCMAILMPMFLPKLIRQRDIMRQSIGDTIRSCNVRLAAGPTDYSKQHWSTRRNTGTTKNNAAGNTATTTITTTTATVPKQGAKESLDVRRSVSFYTPTPEHDTSAPVSAALSNTTT